MPVLHILGLYYTNVHKRRKVIVQSEKQTHPQKILLAMYRQGYLMREIEHFLHSRKLIAEVAEQRAEAKHFLELTQVEDRVDCREEQMRMVRRSMVLYIAPSRSILLLPMSMSVTSRKKNPAIISQFLAETSA